MKLKMIQINIYRGKFLDKLVDFLLAEKPDVVTMQEVSGGKVNFWHDKEVDTFEYLKDALGMDGIIVPIYRLVGDPVSYEGNAVLVRGKNIDINTVWFKAYQEYAQVPWEKEGPEMSRNVLDAIVDFGGTPIHVLATHGAWTKDRVDTSEKVRQAKMLADYIVSLGNEPFILGGDFNMEPGSEVIRTIDAVARNAVYGSGIKNTINLRTHRAAKIFGNGKLVDFIYTSPHFRVERIDAPEVDVSDHLPVRAALELKV